MRKFIEVLDKRLRLKISYIFRRRTIIRLSTLGDLFRPIGVIKSFDPTVGYGFVKTDVLPESVYQFLEQLAQSTSRASSGGSYIKRLQFISLPNDLSSLIRNSNFFLDCYSTAEHYLGCTPMVAEFGLFYSSHAEGPFTSSEEFHLDWEGPRQIKIFHAIGPVHADNGPLEIAKLDDNSLAEITQHYRIRDSHIDEDSKRQIFMQKGQTFGIDTGRVIHRGSRIMSPSQTRLILLIQFVPHRHLGRPMLPYQLFN